MDLTDVRELAVAAAAGALLLCTPGRAEPTVAPPGFEAPVRIKAGDALLGQGRYYPSPVLHDVDGDKLPDIVVGDLMGRITFARRLPSEKGVEFAKEEPLLGRDGKQLKFSNW